MRRLGRLRATTHTAPADDTNYRAAEVKHGRRAKGQRCEAFCARKLLVFMHHARIDFGEIDLRRPISPKSALRNASQRWPKARPFVVISPRHNIRRFQYLCLLRIVRNSSWNGFTAASFRVVE